MVKFFIVRFSFIRLSLICAACLFAACNKPEPVIHSIDPKIGKAGDILVIIGDNFGNEREESYVTIAGASPTNSSYLSWENGQITMKLPEYGETGLIYVYVKGKKSNGALFSNRITIPQQPEGEDSGMEPRIIAVNPKTASIGALISITGSNFGSSREGGGVFFPWSAESHTPIPGEPQGSAFIAVSEADFGYEFWSDREIRLRLPDGADSGNMEVRTLRGTSRPVFFEISGKPGTKSIRDKRSYTISCSVDIKVNEAAKPNSLYLWIPQPAVSASQRNVELLSRNIEPLVENYRGTSLFKLDNLAANSEARVNLAWRVDVYAVETTVLPQSVRQDAASPSLVYTQPSPLIPADDPLIKNQAAALAGRERNPYIKARRIYEWLTGEGIIRNVEEDGQTAGAAPLSVTAALEAKQADPYTAALLYCALLRAAGVPCLPVSGALVNRDRQAVRHCWAEFWIDGFGWIPVDPALGAGAAPPSIAVRPDRASFYFGGMDNRRIAFSRGQIALSQMDPRGRAVSRVRSYSLQNLWEEAVGGIESYSSLWGDIIITGMYVQ